MNDLIKDAMFNTLQRYHDHNMSMRVPGVGEVKVEAWLGCGFRFRYMGYPGEDVGLDVKPEDEKTIIIHLHNECMEVAEARQGFNDLVDSIICE